MAAVDAVADTLVPTVVVEWTSTWGSLVVLEPVESPVGSTPPENVSALITDSDTRPPVSGIGWGEEALPVVEAPLVPTGAQAASSDSGPCSPIDPPTVGAGCLILDGDCVGLDGWSIDGQYRIVACASGTVECRRDGSPCPLPGTDPCEGVGQAACDAVADCVAGQPPCALPGLECPPGTGGSFPACVPDFDCPPPTGGEFPVCVPPVPPLDCPAPTSGEFPACLPPVPPLECPPPTGGEFPVCLPSLPPLECPAGTAGTFPVCLPEDQPCPPPTSGEFPVCVPPSPCEEDPDCGVVTLACETLDADANGDCRPAPPSTNQPGMKRPVFAYYNDGEKCRDINVGLAIGAICTQGGVEWGEYYYNGGYLPPGCQSPGPYDHCLHVKGQFSGKITGTAQVLYGGLVDAVDGHFMAGTCQWPSGHAGCSDFLRDGGALYHFHNHDERQTYNHDGNATAAPLFGGDPLRNMAATAYFGVRITWIP